MIAAGLFSPFSFNNGYACLPETKGLASPGSLSDYLS
jgi:hypothetical protein